MGEVDIDIPCDGNGEFKTQILPKNSGDLSAIEDKVISMYAKDMTQSDISDHIEDVYVLPLSAQTISRMTDKVIPLLTEWQNRPLSPKYYFILMDAIHYKVKMNNRVV